MAIKVIKPGLATSIQDRGRWGYYHVGIPPSGAMDQYSFLAANLLVGNDENAAVLECTYLGPELEFQQNAVVAVTGAEMSPRLNGQEMPLWTSFEVRAGDRLSFDFLKRGARTYVAVSGGIDVPIILGSRSLYGLGAFGGFEGRNLQEGDLLPIGANGSAFVERSVPQDLRIAFPELIEIRVMMGLYDYLLTEEGLKNFFETTWTLTPVADRIGFRYKGSELRFIKRKQPFGAGSDPSNIVDAAYPIGSIQVPGGLEPIILHRDAVSGGGYAMIGTVISADMDAVAQTQPNSKTRFIAVDLDQALAARQERNQRIARLREALAA
ncbi:MAG: biotin-dependent carboxyltransferase [Chloroflexi bacterium]|nr:biotin-dependent carboxyltransferase [Chloroflexota bacterium]